MPHQDFLDLAQRDLALDGLPVAFLGLQDVLAVPVDIDADVITAEVQPLDVGRKSLKSGLSICSPSKSVERSF